MPEARNRAVEHVEAAGKQEERAAGPQAAAGDHRRNKQIEHETDRREQVRRQSPTRQCFAEAQRGVPDSCADEFGDHALLPIRARRSIEARRRTGAPGHRR